MNVGFIKADVVKFASKALLKARKNSPHILVGAGILGFVGTTVLASRETLKAQPLIKDAKGYKHMTDELYQGTFASIFSHVCPVAACLLTGHYGWGTVHWCCPTVASHHATA